MLETKVNRRQSLAALSGSALVASALATPSQSAAQAAPAGSIRRRSLRLAHLTDMHVDRRNRAPQGLAACLQHVQQLGDPVELILTGGDHVMEAFESDAASVKEQWEVWTNGVKSDCSLPIRSAIGNHDIWGWNKTKSKLTGSEPKYGKQLALEMLRLEKRYYSFAQNGWQVIVLDSVQPHPTLPDRYVCYLDDEQYDWLSRLLTELPSSRPVVVLSHVPILSASAVMWSQQERDNFYFAGYLMHTDSIKLKDLFAKHPNVKLCLSGHLHLHDRVDYNGVTYLCNGAVCGNFWKGRFIDCDEGYAVIDLYDDGSFSHEYIKYGWKAEPSST